MKKIAKLIATVLLIASLVSVLAVFPAFAEDVAEQTGVTIHPGSLSVKDQYATVGGVAKVVATKLNDDGTPAKDADGNTIYYTASSTRAKQVNKTDDNGNSYFVWVITGSLRTLPTFFSLKHLIGMLVLLQAVYILEMSRTQAVIQQ